VTDQPVVIEAARALRVTPAQVGLAWLLQHAPNILLISGTSSIDHLRENVAAGEIDIPAEMIAQLEAR
jgi:aryl-alcohol dehydrogenase-like predicted oxidoreductase